MSSSPNKPAGSNQEAESESEWPQPTESESSEWDDESEDQGSDEGLMADLSRLSVGGSGAEKPKVTPPLPLSSNDLAGIAAALKNGTIKKVLVMTGAGVSVSAGIPDFRSPGTGLYANLAKYNLPDPTSIFELGYFKSNPKPFCVLVRLPFHFLVIHSQL